MQLESHLESIWKIFFRFFQSADEADKEDVDVDWMIVEKIVIYLVFRITLQICFFLQQLGLIIFLLRWKRYIFFTYT